MSAIALTSSQQSPVPIVGVVNDSVGIGDGSKITLSRVDATQVRVVARSRGLNSIRVTYCS